MLVESHIIPALVFRTMRRASATGHLRFLPNINQRQQDGMKRPLLCKPCEDRFSIWERSFELEILSQWRTGEEDWKLDYGPWLSKFCVSLSWRVLIELEDRKGLGHLSPQLLQIAKEASLTWRDFLLDRRNFISPFDQFLIPLRFLGERVPPGTPPNMNRYFASSVGFDVVCSERHSFVFTKLPFVVVVGHIKSRNPGEWNGTRIKPTGDQFGRSRQLEMPYVLHEYMASKARRMSEVYHEMSSKQRQKIEEFVKKNPDRVVNSQEFTAFLWDLDLFGDAAVDPLS